MAVVTHAELKQHARRYFGLRAAPDIVSAALAGQADPIDLGVARVRVEAQLSGTPLSTPGSDAIPAGRLIRRAFAVSLTLNAPPGAADVSGLSVTFTPDERVLSHAVLVWAFVPFVLQKTAAGIASLLLTDGANNLKSRVQHNLAINEQRNLGMPRRRFNDLLPGTEYTYKLRAAAAAGATLDVYADVTYPAELVAEYEDS